MMFLASWWPSWLSWPDWLSWPGAAWWSGLWDNTQHGFVWVITCLGLIIGLVGTVLPVLPGHALILAAAVWHYAAMHYWLGSADPGLGWPGFIILVVLVVATQVLETTSSAIGAKYFGSTKWGMFGALAGGLVGLFFSPIGLFLGPVIGALAAELIIARREFKPAAKSTWGTLLGTVAGLLIKVGLGLAMVVYFFLDVFALKW